MSADVLAILVAIAVPVASLAAVVGLVAGLTSLERTREDLIELDPVRR